MIWYVLRWYDMGMVLTCEPRKVFGTWSSHVTFFGACHRFPTKQLFLMATCCTCDADLILKVFLLCFASWWLRFRQTGVRAQYYSPFNQIKAVADMNLKQQSYGGYKTKGFWSGIVKIAGKSKNWKAWLRVTWLAANIMGYGDCWPSDLGISMPSMLWNSLIHYYMTWRSASVNVYVVMWCQSLGTH